MGRMSNRLTSLTTRSLRSKSLNTLRPRQNDQQFADDIFADECIFWNGKVWIALNISQMFVPKVPINNIPSLVQEMAWPRPRGKPLSEPMIVSLLTQASLGLNKLNLHCCKLRYKAHSHGTQLEHDIALETQTCGTQLIRKWDNLASANVDTKELIYPMFQ